MEEIQNRILEQIDSLTEYFEYNRGQKVTQAVISTLGSCSWKRVFCLVKKKHVWNIVERID